ncbi:2-oxo-4-hydroxy-4-carboxy-5-ureidoimidazoline decarboxylase [Halomonas sp. McH1-25]|uniref:2-oxo-4-hydroxy-4-carboxy-5-ureidoimidazoline decarboxylase n=1 Tax=unclassified Halomonas TaxID=2609666 RepID=UPI001EF5C201|nr:MULTISPECIES: 2-oxo-4-hydroxy-4-carboxy-5-ureidoimidazoline decarboxylase [unclassified Halomonas]MCG7599582.1 2-oxo-4-hydroxy-4-carboxy-5-ureidoimidazoline decarboxylase [Halomonas sp. McH1-25]MCP1342145.1 2-oxo-4-hydroxy-4-carboxy-5-ureidoimidazoline decarboxylase [Halomonas sp. FL8]MCP1362356.1 2-oxo-4-hydroxy-4-carboxy-5-ureidoimidazoline decarboxylase [Halomonas sp. BBD45]
MTEPRLSPRPSTLDRDAFVSHYGDIYEHSPWVAELAWDAGLDQAQDTPAGLAELMGRILREAPAERQLDVIRAHPDLAGKAAKQGELTADSTREQAGAGLDQCSAEEFERFHRHNEAYKARFGFPFVMAVKGSDRHRILAAFETRLEHTPAEERRTAIEQINRIARFRLDDRVAD